MPQSQQRYFSFILTKQTFCGLYNRTSSVADLILYSASAVNRRLVFYVFCCTVFVKTWNFLAASAQRAEHNVLRPSGFVTSI